MPKVRASSGMIGTTRVPMPLSRMRFLIMRAKAMVVETAWPPDPLRNSSRADGSGAGSGRAL